MATSIWQFKIFQLLFHYYIQSTNYGNTVSVFKFSSMGLNVTFLLRHFFLSAYDSQDTISCFIVDSDIFFVLHTFKNDDLIWTAYWSGVLGN